MDRESAATSRVLIGARFTAEQRAALAGDPALVIEEEAAGVAQRAETEVFSLVIVDRGLEDVGTLVQRLEPPTALLLLDSERIGRTVREWRARQGAEGTAPSSLVGAFVSTLEMGAGVQRSLAFDAASAAARTDARGTRPGTIRARLGRAQDATARSAQERKVLEAAFAERELLLAGSLTTQEVATLLGVSRQTPHDRVRAKSLLAIDHKGGLAFPLWQFDASGAGGVVPGLPDVLKALEVGPFAQARWLTLPSPVFEGRSPIEALKAGEVDRVVSEAQGVGATAGHG